MLARSMPKIVSGRTKSLIVAQPRHVLVSYGEPLTSRGRLRQKPATSSLLGLIPGNQSAKAQGGRGVSIGRSIGGGVSGSGIVSTPAIRGGLGGIGPRGGDSGVRLGLTSQIAPTKRNPILKTCMVVMTMQVPATSSGLAGLLRADHDEHTANQTDSVLSSRPCQPSPQPIIRSRPTEESQQRSGAWLARSEAS
jgi:hypothetical protein